MLKEFACIGPFVRNQDNDNEMEIVDILVPVFLSFTYILHCVNVLDECQHVHV